MADGVLQEQEVASWWQAAGESYATPDTDELVVFDSFYYRGFGVLVHPFLRKLIAYYGIILCNLHPNSILHVSIFIHFYECWLGIPLHFNLFLHFFWLKKRGSQGSKVVSGAYL